MVLFVYVTVRIAHVSSLIWFCSCAAVRRAAAGEGAERGWVRQLCQRGLPVEKILEAELQWNQRRRPSVEANLSAPANSVSQSLPLNHTRWHSTYGEHLANLKCAVSELHFTIAPQWASRLDHFLNASPEERFQPAADVQKDSLKEFCSCPRKSQMQIRSISVCE